MSEPAAAYALPLAEAYALAELRLRENRPEEAAHLCGVLLGAYPDDLRAHLLAGEALLRLGEDERSRARFEAASTADPEEAEAHAGLGRLAERAGNIPAALRRYDAALQLDPALACARERVAALRGADAEAFGPAALTLLRLRGGDVLGALAEWGRLDSSVREESWMRLALLEALWRAGCADEAEALALELLESVPGSIKPALILSFRQALRGDLSGSAAALEDLRAFDPAGEWVLERAHMAPLSWQGAAWEASIIADDASEPDRAAVGAIVVGEEEAREPAEAPSADATLWAEAYVAAPAATPPPPDAPTWYSNDSDLPPDPAREAVVESADVVEEVSVDTGAGQSGRYVASEAELMALYGDLMGGADEPILPRSAVRAESEPGGPISPEAPVLPEPGPDGPEPGPEIPDGPADPGVSPTAPQPEIQPDYTPQPEIPDAPATPLPEIPRMPVAPPDSPGGVPSMTLGMEAEVLSRAGELEAAGYDADAVDLYAQALRRGEASAAVLLPRVRALEPRLAGYAPWHQLFGELYRREGMSRRAMREFQLALKARRRST